jgi:hypothetical protein
VHHQAHGFAPQRLGDRALEKRRDHQVGTIEARRLDRHRVGDVELDRELVAARGELGVQALREAVEAVREQEDAHR